MWERWNATTKIFEKSTDNGGSWTPLGLDASIITQGTIGTTRLPANLAFKDIDNSFSAGQTINGTLLVAAGNFLIQGGYIWPSRVDVGGAPSQGGWYLASHASYGLYTNTGLYVAGHLWSANNVFAGSSFNELGRSASIGYWITVPFDAASYGRHSGTGSWTLTSVSVIHNKYCLIGKTMIWAFYISWFHGGNTLVAAPTHLFIKLPIGYSGGGNQILSPAISINGPRFLPFDCAVTGDRLVVNKQDGSAFTASPVGIVGTFVIEIA